ncbi:MAG: TIM barrel protein [Thermoguttaceae bacterium]|jgi:hydroxypyruvate isomerase|nr:TIM barrel protein [Thermoguttaceae bacterium]
MTKPSQTKRLSGITRRHLLRGAAGAAALAAAMPSALADEKGAAVRHGRIKQSIVQWCFSPAWDTAEMCRIARQLGVTSIELVGAADYPTLKRFGLTSAIVQIDMDPDPPFVFGFNNPDHHERVIKATRKAIDDAAEFGYKRVICFTGYKYLDPRDPSSPVIDDAEAMANCVVGLKKVIGYAEKKGITLCLEQLNTRDDTHPMKGHPGYQGDDIDYCAGICRAVGSPNMKLLFDLYHVQIMNGDLIRRIHQYRDLLGHIHVAGNPGRNEPDGSQEINSAACMKALLDVEYDGFVGLEFIPTRDPLKSLREAIVLCDV